ncbi:UNVERIFIED_CONTAM: hypothetical protein HDU68_009695 [Siphonaria sp. JEL0065]|nr:hypothetical protein HDU68_009695 [Siphonaria sp. JEL0065]
MPSPRESAINQLGLDISMDLHLEEGEIGEEDNVFGAVFFDRDEDPRSFLHFGRSSTGGNPFEDSTVDPFSPNFKANTSTPFSIKSAFKVKPLQDDNWSPFGKPAMIDFTKELEPLASTVLTAMAPENHDPFATEQPNTTGIGNILDETFDISGHDFSPTNSGCSSPSSNASEISNISFKPDEFILGNSQNTTMNIGAPASPPVADRSSSDFVDCTPQSTEYLQIHPISVIGKGLYECIKSGGVEAVYNSPSTRNLKLEADEFAKTPMSRYFAEKSCKLGGKLGELVDAEERPYFQTPKRDRNGKVVDMIPETPPMEERKGLSKNAKKVVGKSGVVGKGKVAAHAAAPLIKKPLYIRSPALGKARVTVKWDGGQLRREVAKRTIEKPAPAATKPPANKLQQKNVQYKTRRVATPATRKPLYQPPPPRPIPRNTKPVVSKPISGPIPFSRHPISIISTTASSVSVYALKPAIKNPASAATAKTITAERKLFIPHSTGSKHILQELVFPSTNNISTTSSAPVKSASRKSIYIPPPPLPHTPKTLHPTQKTFIRLYNPLSKPTPFYISSTSGAGGTRDGKPCAFYTSFRFQVMKGVVAAEGYLDVEVKSLGVLRGVYVQSFRVFANRGSVAFTLRTVV